MQSISEDNMKLVNGGAGGQEEELCECPTCNKKTLKVFRGTMSKCTNPECKDYGKVKTEL